MTKLVALALGLAVLAFALPAITVNAQGLTEFEGGPASPITLHHGSFSCRLKGNTSDGSPFDIVIAYQENRRGLITSADVFKWKAAWYLDASWSWFAYEVNINVRQWSKRYSRRCFASAIP